MEIIETGYMSKFDWIIVQVFHTQTVEFWGISACLLPV